MNDSIIKFSHTYATPFLLIGISVLHLSLMTGMPVLICSYYMNACATPVTNDRIACAHLFLWQEHLCFTCHSWQECLCSFVLMTGTSLLHLLLMTGMPVLIFSYDRNFCASFVTHDRNTCAHLFLCLCFTCPHDINVWAKSVLVTGMSVLRLSLWQECLSSFVLMTEKSSSFQMTNVWAKYVFMAGWLWHTSRTYDRNVCDEPVLMTEMSVQHLGHIITFNMNARSTMSLLYVGNRRLYS